MNLERNHILCAKENLLKLCKYEELPKEYFKETPPEVDNDYLAPDNEYFDIRKENIENAGTKITTVIPKDRDKKNLSLFDE
jgi:hypothetical protein